MYLDICAVSNHLRGVIDTKKRIVVVPPEYVAILYFENGFICENEAGKMSAFLPNGLQIFKDADNLLFVNDSLLLVSNTEVIYLYDYVKRSLVFNLPVNELLLFVGNNEQTIPYNAKVKVYSLIESYGSLKFHLEDLVCARYNNYWGIINIKNGTIPANFEYLEIAQYSNHRIAIRDKNGQSYKYKC